jgi:hypothetical protein
MWTAAKRTVSGLPTLSSALKFTGGMFGFSVLCANLQGHNNAHWAGDLKKKTWSSEFDIKDRTSSKTYETQFRTDPETGYRYPVGVIRSKRTRADGKTREPGPWFQPIEIDATGWETATWEFSSVPRQ